MNKFIDFITGGFFNYLGAGWRKLFSKEKYSVLVEEDLSNSYGMMISAILFLAALVYIKVSVF
jgi:hypothetical protein